MTAATVVGHLIVGPHEHGVVTFAESLARHLGGPVLRFPHWPGTAKPAGTALRELATAADVVHVQFTDALYAPRCDLAAERFTQMCLAVNVPVSVTLHDLPDPQDAPIRYARRCAAYRRVVSAVDALVVSSEHEARLLAAVLNRPPDAHVIPLPVGPRIPAEPQSRPTHRSDDASIGLLGFIHPGKEYAVAIHRLAAVHRRLTITALGRAADGHEELPPLLASLAVQAGHRWHLTGFVPAEQLQTRLHGIDVPLVPHPGISASGSLNTWLGAGRRPLVADGRYARELAARLPGAVRLYGPGELASAVEGALRHPASTWLEDTVNLGPDGVEAAGAYRQALVGVQ